MREDIRGDKKEGGERVGEEMQRERARERSQKYLITDPLKFPGGQETQIQIQGTYLVSDAAVNRNKFQIKAADSISQADHQVLQDVHSMLD